MAIDGPYVIGLLTLVITVAILCHRKYKHPIRRSFVVWIVWTRNDFHPVRQHRDNYSNLILNQTEINIIRLIVYGWTLSRLAPPFWGLMCCAFFELLMGTGDLPKSMITRFLYDCFMKLYAVVNDPSVLDFGSWGKIEVEFAFSRVWWTGETRTSCVDSSSEVDRERRWKEDIPVVCCSSHRTKEMTIL